MKNLGATVKIVIAHDQKLYAEGVGKTLKREYHFDVLWYSFTSQELIQRLSDSQILPDVLLLDIDLKPIDGFKVFEEIHSLYPQMKVLAFMLNTDWENVKRAQSCGFHGIILKECDLDTLVNAIQTVNNNITYFPYSNEVTNGSAESIHAHNGLGISISPRESRFLQLCADANGYKYEEIAKIMDIKVRTVHSYRDKLFAKISVHNRTGLIAYYHHLEMGR